MNTKTSLLHSPWTQKPLSCTPHEHKNLSPALPMNTKTSLLHSPWTQKPLSCTRHEHKNLSPAHPMDTKMSSLYFPCHQTGLLGNSYAFRQWWEPFNVSLWGTVTRQVSTDHNFWRGRRAEVDSNWGSSAYQPNTLSLGQTGLQKCSFEGMGGLKGTGVRREIIPLLWSNLSKRVGQRFYFF